jgi:hypothetical protein
MASTDFSAGTVIASAWLDDVNTATYKSFVNVKTYGALGDGVTDDTAAITAAIAAAANRTLYFPAGTYVVSSALSLANPITIEGEFHNSIIKTSHVSANIFTVNSNYVRIRQIVLDSSVVRVGGWFIDIPGGVEIFITDCDFNAYLGGIRNNGTTVDITGCQFHNGIATTSVGIRIDNGFDVSIRNVIMSLPAQGYAGIYVTQTADLSIEDCQILQCGQGLYLDPGAGQSITSVWCNNVFFDTCARGMYAHANAAGSSILRCVFDQCWFASSSSGGALLAAPVGTINGMDFNGCQFFLNTGNGITVNDSNVREVHIRNSDLCGNTGSGAAFAANVSDFSVINSRIGASHGFLGNATGVFIDAGTGSNYLVANNIVTSNTVAPITDGGTGTGRVLHTNNDWGIGRATYDPGNLVDGAGVTTVLAVTGAMLGDIVDCSFSLDTQGISLFGYVYSAGNVAVRFQNETGGAIDLGSGTLRAAVRRHS